MGTIGSKHAQHLANVVDIPNNPQIVTGDNLMTDENNFDALDDDIQVLDTDQAVDVVQDTLDTFLEAASVDAVYGQPIQSGENTIIPAAEVLSGLGFGVGSGYGSGSAPSDEEEGQAVGSGGGSGGGGGGRVLARPVAVIIASPEGVRVEPVVDATKIALAALTAAGFMMGMMMRMLSPKKAMKELQ
jgi:uncharacterized spore protein YtfJ